MRRIFSILFTILFLFNTVGYYPLFLLRKNGIRNKINALINENTSAVRINVLSFALCDAKSLKWLKEDEFIYQGDLYDVVKREVGQDGKMYFYCINDTKEKKLTDQFEKHLTHQLENENRNQKNEQNIFKNICKDFCPPEKVIVNFEIVLELNFLELTPSFFNVPSEELVPPPKVSC